MEEEEKAGSELREVCDCKAEEDGEEEEEGSTVAESACAKELKVEAEEATEPEVREEKDDESKIFSLLAGGVREEKDLV